jgi:hypothetical protein
MPGLKTRCLRKRFFQVSMPRGPQPAPAGLVVKGYDFFFVDTYNGNGCFCQQQYTTLLRGPADPVGPRYAEWGAEWGDDGAHALLVDIEPTLF